MKKMFLSLLALVLFALGGHAQQANIYASGLKAGTPANEEVDISYVLNVDAAALSVNFMDEATVVATVDITEAALLTKGAHTATLSLATMPAGTFTWTLKATGVATNTNTAAQPIKVGTLSSFGNTHRVAIDKDPNHSTFGRIYITDAGTGKKGIWALNPDLSLVNPTPYTGGVAWGTSVTASPLGIDVAPDGKVFVTDWSDAYSGVWIMDNENPSNPFTQVFSVIGDNLPVHGSIMQCRVTGTGADTKLYTMDEDLNTFSSYDIGSATLPWATAPSNKITVTTPTPLYVAHLNFVSDGQGGWWYLQSRASEGSNQPAVMHIRMNSETSATVDFNSYDAGLAIGNTGTGSAALAINSDHTLLAIGAAGNIKVYTISGVPTAPALTLKYSFAHAIGVTSNVLKGLEFDVAGNLYAVGYGATNGLGNVMCVYALPNEDASQNTFTTPAPSTSTITIAEEATLKMLYTKTGYTWNASNYSRDAAYYDGKIYATDNSGKQLHVLDATNGTELSQMSDANYTGYSVTTDDAGNKYVTTGAYGMTACLNGTLLVGAGKTYANTPLSYSNVRADYVAGYGDFATEGYLATATSAGATVMDNIYVWKIASGAFVNATNPTTITDKRTGGVAAGADIDWIDATHIFVTGQTKVPQIITLDLATPANSTSASIGSTPYPVGGGAYFKIFNTPYMAVPSDAFGAIKVFDITDPTTPVQVGATTAAIGATTNGTIHVAIDAVVDNNTATIYVWAPNNGLAVHQLSVRAISEPPVEETEKTFTVTVPNGTEHVYVAGTFTGKEWDITTPYELMATANANEFTGTFACEDGVEYKYFCEKGDLDYVEGIAGAPGQPAEALANNRTIATGDAVTDAVPFWYNVKKIKFEVTFGAAVTVPNQLSVRVWPNNEATSSDLALTKSGSKYTGAYGGNAGDKFKTNTQYKYFISSAAPVWEIHENRQAETPAVSDQITGFETATLSGTYYIPKSGEQQGWNSLYAACSDINTFGIAGDVTLLITADLAEPKNIGLINPTNHHITISPDADANRTITFSQPNDNAGPSGAICLGIGTGIAWADMAPAKNITIDGAFNGGTDRRLKIATSSSQNGLNGPILIMDECSNIVIKNTVIEHVGAASGSGNYAIYLRVNTAYGTKKMPVDVSILNNEITNTTAGSSSQGIGIYANADPTSLSTGVVIKDNIIRARTRGIFLGEVDGIEITGNEFHVNQSSNGLLSAGIFSFNRVNGTIKVSENRFIELKSGNKESGNYGAKGIVTAGATSTWYIDNNYFTGFDKTTATSGTTMLQGIHLVNLAGAYVRHNTFYLNPVTERPTNSATPAATDASYSAINIEAGTPVIQNNLFVSGEDAFANFFICGNVPFAATDNNVFCLPAEAVNAKIASGTAPLDLKTVANVVFEDAAAGILDLSGASNKDRNLGVAPLADVLGDIYGTLRSTTLAYAGAFEGDEFESGDNITTPALNSNIRIADGKESIRLIADGTIIKGYTLYNATGVQILKGTALASEVEISTNRLSAGVYVIQIATDNGTVVKRFIKK